MTLSDEYTPTTVDVRWAYVVGEFERRGMRGPMHDRGRPFYEAFDEWLAAHDRQVAAKALTDAAEHITDDYLKRALLARAAALGVPEEAKHG